MEDKNFTDAVLDEAENIQEELHNFVSDVMKSAELEGEKVSYQDAANTFFITRIASQRVINQSLYEALEIIKDKLKQINDVLQNIR